MKTIIQSILLTLSLFVCSGVAGAEGTPVTWDVGTTDRIGNVVLKDGNVSANGVRAKNVSGSTVSGNYFYAHGGMMGDVKFGTDGTVTGIPDAGNLETADPSAAVNVKTLKEVVEKLEQRVETLETENAELRKLIMNNE